MLDLLHISALNTMRNARRSAITVLSIAIGCAALSCFGAFINFSFEGLREITIRTQLGHLQIYAEGYWERRVSEPSAVMIRDLAALEESLEAIEGVSSVTHRLTLSGVGTAGQSTVSMSLIGVDPVREMEFADFEIVVEGRNLLPGDTDKGVIGSELAKGIDAEVGDWVTVLTTSLDGMINAVDFQIAGVVSTGSVEYDSVFVKVPAGLVQRALDTTAVERVIVLLDETDQLPKIEPLIQAALAAQSEAYETRTWSELASFYNAVVDLYLGLFRIFAAIIAVVVIFSVANTMTMAVFERTGESGALRAIGAPRSTIMSMFLYEGLILGLLGGVAGVLLSFAISWGTEAAGGIPMPPPPSSSQGYQAYFPMSPLPLAIGFAISVAAALVSSLYPAWAASRGNIVEALQKP